MWRRPIRRARTMSSRASARSSPQTATRPAPGKRSEMRFCSVAMVLDDLMRVEGAVGVALQGDISNRRLPPMNALPRVLSRLIGGGATVPQSAYTLENVNRATAR